MSTTNQEIMEATYRALVDNGYAGLSIRDITKEFDGSQSLIYYHYDNKEDLLTRFIAFLIEELERELDDLDEDDPADRLRAVIDLVLPSTTTVEELMLQQALSEIRVQTPYHTGYCELFHDIDRRFRTELETTIGVGLEDGTFTGVTPHEGADLLLLLLYGIAIQYVPMRDQDGIERGQNLVNAEIDRWSSSTATPEE